MQDYTLASPRARFAFLHDHSNVSGGLCQSCWGDIAVSADAMHSKSCWMINWKGILWSCGNPQGRDANRLEKVWDLGMTEGSWRAS